MNEKPLIRVSIALAVLVMFFLAACGTSPSARYYALSSMTEVKTADIKSQHKDVVIVSVGPVGIPDYLDRKQIVTRDSGSRLDLADFDLWGGSLDNDVTRVVADNLSILLAPKGINAVTWRSRVPYAHTISISMTRFEASGDSVILRAQWGIMENGEQTAETVRESVITKPLGGKDYGDIVAAMSEATADLSREIAVEVVKAVKKSKKAGNN